MKRKLLLMSVMMVIPVMSMPVSAGSPLSVVPEEAIAFVTIPNASALDAGIERTLMQLGLADMVPANNRSLLYALKNNLGLSEGLNESGAVTLIIMPAENRAMVPGSIALSIPSTKPSELLAALNPVPGPDGVPMVQLMDTPMGALAGEEHVIFAVDPAKAKAIMENKSSIESRLSSEEKAGLGDLSFALWADAGGWKKVFAEDLQGFLDMIKFTMTMQGMSPEDADGQLAALNMMIEGSKSMYFGLGLRENGLDFRAGFEVMEGSELAKIQKGAITTSKPMLHGLPDEPFVLAFGQIASMEQLKANREFQEKQMANMWAGIPAEQREKLKPQLDKISGSIASMATMVTGGRASVSVLPAGPDGIAGLTVLATTSNPDQFIGYVKTIYDAVKTMDLGEDAAEFAAAMGAMNWSEKADSIDGTDIHEVSFEVLKMDVIDEEEWSEVTKVIGRDGLKLRIAAVNDNTVAIAFGGGKARMADVLAAAKSDSSGLEQRAGVIKAAPTVLKDRTMCGYVNADEIVRMIREITKAMDEEDVFPLTMPKLESPVAMAIKTTNNSTRGDMHVPMEVMVAVKDMVMTLMGMGANAGPPADMGM